VERVAERTQDARDCLLARRKSAHAGERDGADGTVVVHDGLAVAQAFVDVSLRGGNACEEVFEEEHVQGLRKDRPRGLRACVGDDGRMDDECLEEPLRSLWTDDRIESFV